jgi:hypothetical protein
MIISLMDPILQRYSEGVSYVSSNPAGTTDRVLMAIKVTECQLAWLTAVISAIVGGAGSTTSISSYYNTTSAAITTGSSMGEEVFDADLCQRVFRLMSQTDMRLVAAAGGLDPRTASQNPMVRAIRADARLELALLHFSLSFRRSFITETAGMPASTLSTTSQAFQAGGVASVQHNSHQINLQELSNNSTGRAKVFANMFLRMNIGDHVTVMMTVLSKLTSNLRYWVDREEIIRRSIEVLHDLVYSYSSARLLLSMDSITTLLTGHSEDALPFLAVPSNSRLRTTFYESLARLVFLEDECEVSCFFEPSQRVPLLRVVLQTSHSCLQRFDTFFVPIAARLEQLRPAVNMRNDTVMVRILRCRCTHTSYVYSDARRCILWRKTDGRLAG